MPLVLYDSGSTFHTKWAAQYVAADARNRKSAGISGSLGPEQVRDTILQACHNVTGDREILFAVGHGGAAMFPDEGTVDLAPAKKFRLSRGDKPGIYIDPFYNYVFPHSGLAPQSDKQIDETLHPGGWQRRLQHWAVYSSLGTAMKANHIYRVTFLTCRVGNALDFIKKISIDWGTLVKAYKRYVWFTIDGQTGKARAYLDGDQPGAGTNTVQGETELPQVDFVTVGPPLPQPAATQSSSSSRAASSRSGRPGA